MLPPRDDDDDTAIGVALDADNENVAACCCDSCCDSSDGWSECSGGGDKSAGEPTLRAAWRCGDGDSIVADGARARVATAVALSCGVTADELDVTVITGARAPGDLGDEPKQRNTQYILRNNPPTNKTRTQPPATHLSEAPICRRENWRMRLRRSTCENLVWTITGTSGLRR